MPVFDPFGAPAWIESGRSALSFVGRNDVWFAMRSRDVRAITFCAITIPGLFVASVMLLDNGLASAALTAAYAAWLLTRPRMIRVMRRLRGEPVSAWGAYYRD